jgi:hypothetical protein
VAQTRQTWPSLSETEPPPAHVKSLNQTASMPARLQLNRAPYTAHGRGCRNLTVVELSRSGKGWL